MKGDIVKLDLTSKSPESWSNHLESALTTYVIRKDIDKVKYFTNKSKSGQSSP